MKNFRSSAGGILFRAMGFLLAGLMVSMVFLGTLDTQSWFFSKTAANMEVAAATTDDIVHIMGVDRKENPQYITLKGSSNLQHDAMIYFAVEGDIDEYILHIDPVKLQSGIEYKIPIVPNVNAVQYRKLWQRSWQEKVKGRISIKYMNEFINEGLEIEFTKEYLREKFIEEIKRQEVKTYGEGFSSMMMVSEEIDEIDYKRDITSIITYLSSHWKWPDGISSPIQGDPLDSDNLIELFQGEKEGILIEKPELDQEQSKIISIIAPRLQQYLNNAYDVMVKLVAEIKDMIQRIDILNKQVEDLEDQIEDLKEEKNQLHDELEKVKEEIESLRNENQRLREENDSLRGDIDSLTLDLNNARASSVQVSSGGGGSSPLAPVPVPIKKDPAEGDSPQEEQQKETVKNPDEEDHEAPKETIGDKDQEENKTPEEGKADDILDEGKHEENPVADNNEEDHQPPKAAEESKASKGDDTVGEQPKEAINENTYDQENTQTNPENAANDNNTGKVGDRGGEKEVPSRNDVKPQSTTDSQPALEKDG